MNSPAPSFISGEPNSLVELKNNWDQAQKKSIPLLLLPPTTEAEKNILLRQLPNATPAGIDLIVFSSGTTGAPKAIFHSVKNIKWNAEKVATKLRQENIKSYFSALPPWSMAGFLFGFFLPTYFSFKIHSPEDKFIFFAPHFFSQLQEKSWDATILNPFHLQILEKCNKEIPPIEHKFISLTAPLPAPQRRFWESSGFIRIFEIYGMTETAGPILWEGEGLGATLSQTEERELNIESPSLALFSSEAGALSPIPRPYPSGDIVRTHSSHGHQAWEIVGRKREMVNVGGKTVAPAMVEAIVSSYPGVIAACAGKLADSDYGERIGLLVETNSQFDAQLFPAYLRANLSFEQQPKKWMVRELPRNSAGKILRAQAMLYLA